MVDKNLCEVILIIDKSGSMDNLRDTTISKVNEFVDMQKKLPVKVRNTICFFNHEVSFFAEDVDIKNYVPLSRDTYIPSGYTALYDAIGITFDRVGKRYAELDEDKRPGTVFVAIMTDGQENASKKYIHSQIKGMIEKQQKEYSWKIEFLGAGISEDIGRDIGIVKCCSASASPNGLNLLYRSAGSSLSSLFN